jgi:hypothetical protein
MRGTKSYRAGGLPAPSLAIHRPFDERDFARVMRPHRIPVRLVKPDIALKKQANTLNLRLRSGRGLVARHECPDWSKTRPRQERPLLARSGHSLERRDQAKPNYIAISIHMSSQVYPEWRAKLPSFRIKLRTPIGASLRI